MQHHRTPSAVITPFFPPLHSFIVSDTLQPLLFNHMFIGFWVTDTSSAIIFPSVNILLSNEPCAATVIALTLSHKQALKCETPTPCAVCAVAVVTPPR